MQFAAKQGKLVIDDNEMSLTAPFNRLVWSVRHEDVARVDSRSGGIMAILNVQLHNGTIYQTELGKVFAERVVQFYSQREGVQAVQAQPRRFGMKWYEDTSLTVHMETYTNEKEMKREVEKVARYGWVPQVEGMKGHINVGRTTTAAVLTGGFSLLLGASRTKDKYTVTFIRQQQ